MIKAIIFDMDGLMIDSELATYQSYQHVLQQMDLSITKDFYCTLLGKTVPHIASLFYQEYGNDFPFETVIADTHTHMEEQFEIHGIPVKEGLVPLLQYLKENQYKTIVATSSQRKRADTILAKANLTAYFDDTICGDEITNGKPNPEIFIKAAQKLGVTSEEALVLEDSEPGIQAAYDANIAVICVPDMKYPEPDYASKATKILDSLTDVLTFIKENK